MKKLFLLIFAAGLTTASAYDPNDPIFHHSDVLAPHDEWGRLHQSKELHSTDYDRRYRWRFLYYFEGARDLPHFPAYIGALQEALKRNGYYCGPIDGVYSDEVSYAIAQLQKNHAMRVTGTITIPVRRVLHLP